MLDRRSHVLIAPDVTRVELSECHLAELECFAQAAGEHVTREALHAKAGVGYVFRAPLGSI
jgi:two-component system OmpR family response regulator